MVHCNVPAHAMSGKSESLEGAARLGGASSSVVSSRPGFRAANISVVNPNRSLTCSSQSCQCILLDSSCISCVCVCVRVCVSGARWCGSMGG